jgi:hypothetical protein
MQNNVEDLTQNKESAKRIDVLDEQNSTLVRNRQAFRFSVATLDQSEMTLTGPLERTV